MQDFFAVLGEARRPWIDADLLRRRFHELSSSFHPDRFHGQSVQEQERATGEFAILNAAYQCLRDPKLRLSHLIQLERGGPPTTIQAIPNATANLFMRMVELGDKVDKFLNEKANATSPMMKVQIFETGLEWSEQITQAQATLNQRRDEVLERVKEADSRWRTKDSVEQLETICNELSYLDRWTGQLRERLGKVMA